MTSKTVQYSLGKQVDTAATLNQFKTGIYPYFTGARVGAKRRVGRGEN